MYIAIAKESTSTTRYTVIYQELVIPAGMPTKSKIKADRRMGRTIKISDVVFELLRDIGKKSETYSQVIERIAKEANYEIKPEYVKS
jgi:hypothetical protein